MLYTPPTWIFLYRGDGAEYEFKKISGTWRSQSGNDIALRISEGTGTLLVTDLNDTIETYDNNTTTGGRLTQVRYKNGYTQTLSYDGNNRLQTIMDSNGKTLTFSHTALPYPLPVFPGNPTEEVLLTTLTLPNTQEIRFAYADYSSQWAFPKKLSEVIYPDDTPLNPNDNPRITYLYENPTYPRAITGYIDEKGQRFATWGYDNKGRVNSSTHAGGAGQTTVTYNTDGTRTVTNELGKETIYHFSNVQGAPKVTQVEGLANGTCEAANQNYTYSSSTGYPTSKIDWKGNRTNYTYNTRGLQESRTEAFGTPLARTITTTWDTNFRVPTLIVAPGKSTSFTYDSNGWLQTRTETDTTSHSIPYSTNGQQRTWTYTYTAAGLIHTIDGPRTDVSDITTYDYDTSGNLSRITNALAQQINITQYDPNGLPLTIVDANNVTSTLTYNARNWLQSVTTAGATTQFDYEPTGNISRLTLPNGAYFNYEYDAAQRLTAIENNLGERVEFTLDAMGNRTAINIKNGSGTVVYVHTKTFDALGRLLHDIGAASQTAIFGYDKNDNQTSRQNPRSYTTAWAFDALDRMYQTTDALTNVTAQSYDNRDNLTGVTDPRLVATSYVYNGFGEPIYESSPDSGNTTLYRDPAGNITQKIDGRGIIANMTYDALNRVLTESYPAATSENRTYLYDNATSGEYGKGRFYRVTDDSGSTTYAYDARGNIVKNTHVVGGWTYITRYEYNNADQLLKLVYPSGRIVNYNRDVLGRISSVTTQTTSVSASVNVATAITYNPYGDVTGWAYGNGLSAQMNYDNDYRLVDIIVKDGSTDVHKLHYTFDANDNIDTITDAIAPARSQSFIYDALDRLTQATGIYGVESYGYDSASNRTSKTNTGGLETYSYASTSNRLNSITKNSSLIRQFTYDGAGNIALDNESGQDLRGLNYNKVGRYSQLDKNTQASTIYRYNALGERVLKGLQPQYIEVNMLAEAYPVLKPLVETLPEELQDIEVQIAGTEPPPEALSGPPWSATIPAIAGVTHYHYDLNNTLIAESLSNGKVQREYIYLPAADGESASLPLAHLNNTNNGSSTNEMLLILNDHLRTPAKLTNSAKAIVWDRTQTPYGENATLAGTKETNLRLPGQYYDLESGYHYNLMRDYDAKTGRYLQSDPIGLAGGINRFGYVTGNPVNLVDPTGENPVIAAMLAGAAISAAIDTAMQLYENNGNISCLDYNSIALSAGIGAALPGGFAGLGKALPKLIPPNIPNLLMPAGKMIGTAGSKPAIRVVKGDLKDAEKLFNSLSKGGTKSINYPTGSGFNLPNGGFVGLRTTAERSPNTVATIDVNIPGLFQGKIKFNP